MYIRKQPSGSTEPSAGSEKKGRGEYEISGEFGATPPVRAEELFDKQLVFEFGRYGYKPSGTVLGDNQGKNRIRLLDTRRNMHGARQVQAALLFPQPRRDEEGLLGGRPTLIHHRYLVRHMHFRGLELLSDSVRIQLGDLDFENRTEKETVNFSVRMGQVESVHDNVQELPDKLRQLVIEHRTIMEAQAPIPKRAEAIVRELMKEAESIAPDYDIDYASGTDVLAPLSEMLNQPHIEKPIPIESIPPEDVEIRLREAAKWRRFVAVRGPEAAAFRRKVREAYDSRCIVCGIRLPASSHCRVPGVDSAHILPWASHDMDYYIGNGLCLCRMHHWAFDQQLIAITHENEEYHVKVTDRAREALDDEALQILTAHAGPVVRARLPQNPQHWPRPQLLAELYQLVGG